MEEDDLDLIEENTGVRIPGRQKGFRRLKRRNVESSENTTRGKDSLEDLFEDEKELKNYKKISYRDDEEELDDFIVDDEDQPIPKANRTERKKVPTSFSSELFLFHF